MKEGSLLCHRAALIRFHGHDTVEYGLVQLLSKNASICTGSVATVKPWRWKRNGLSVLHDLPLQRRRKKPREGYTWEIHRPPNMFSTRSVVKKRMEQVQKNVGPSVPSKGVVGELISFRSCHATSAAAVLLFLPVLLLKSLSAHQRRAITFTICSVAGVFDSSAEASR